MRLHDRHGGLVDQGGLGAEVVPEAAVVRTGESRVESRCLLTTYINTFSIWYAYQFINVSKIYKE